MNERKIVKKTPVSVSPACARAILEGRKSMVRQLAVGGAFSCPFGDRDDLLWVREPWALVDGVPIYHSTHRSATDIEWQPAKSMPENHARIWLRVIATRLERLADIPEEDFAAEGALWLEKSIPGEAPRAGFARWWDSLHPRSGTRWADDPWVWVLSFART